MFYTFSQNNSGGYFVENEKYGIGEYVIIEESTPELAFKKLMSFDSVIKGFLHSCRCCGDRWFNKPIDSSENPEIWGENVYESYSSSCMEKCFIHRLDETIEKIIFNKQ